MSLRTYAEMQRWDPLRRPDWRFERVLQMADRFPTPGRCTNRDDEWVRKARNFVLKWRNRPDARDDLWREEPGLWYAYRLKEAATEDPNAPFTIEARLLAGQPDAEVAHEAQTITPTVTWYGKLFFDVADSLGHHDWVLRQVLIPAARRAGEDRASRRGKASYDTAPIVDPFLDYSLKFFAYFGGPLLLEVMLSGFVRGNRLASRDDAEQFADAYHARVLKFRSAQAAGTFEVNKFNVTELFAAHHRLLEIQRAVEADDGRGNAMEKSVGALLREFPWASGPRARRALEGTPLAEYDGHAAELRDEELLLTAAGSPPASAAGLKLLTLPPPRPREHGGANDAELR